MNEIVWNVIGWKLIPSIIIIFFIKIKKKKKTKIHLKRP